MGHGRSTERISSFSIWPDFNNAGNDGLTAEHLQFCHPVLSVILSKMFQLMLLCSFVPYGFKSSYIVPIPIPKECYSKALNCNDFRGIAISQIVSKMFEHCIINRFDHFLHPLIASLVSKKVVDVVWLFVRPG